MFRVFQHDEQDRQLAEESQLLVAHSSTGIEEHEFLEDLEY